MSLHRTSTKTGLWGQADNGGSGRGLALRPYCIYDAKNISCFHIRDGRLDIKRWGLKLLLQIRKKKRSRERED